MGTPPLWVDTDIVFRLVAAPEGGARVLFDHVVWKDAEDMVWIVACLDLAHGFGLDAADRLVVLDRDTHFPFERTVLARTGDWP